MCEIDITKLASVDMWPFAHSAFEGGQSAGSNTWNAAVAYARENAPLLLAGPDEEASAVDWLADFGAWERSELEAMKSAELNALVLQFIAGNVRESGADSLDEIEWDAYIADQEAGRVSSGIYRGDNGALYFYMGNNRAPAHTRRMNDQLRLREVQGTSLFRGYRHESYSWRVTAPVRVLEAR